MMTVDGFRRFVAGWRLEPDDRRWLGAALGVGVGVYLAYLLVYPYPAHGAGLYFEVVKQVSQHGYRLPVRIPYYTEGGVPFAYPPLSFYLLAALRDVTGLGPLAIARSLPGLVTVAYLVPYYFLARALLGSARRAGVATILLAVTPPLLTWHLAAGGVVRAPAFLFALAAICAAVRLFRTGDHRWLPPAAVLFGLTVLTHPVYAVFAGASTVLAYAAFDRSPPGLLAGVAIAGGGLVLAAPWWLVVASTHGPGIFAAAAGTHDGLGGGLPRLYGSFVQPLVASGSWPLYALATAGAVLLAWRRRFFLPAWWLVTGVLLDQHRFLFVAGSMASAVFVLDVLVPGGRSLSGRLAIPSGGRRAVPVAIGVFLVAAILVVGAIGAGGPRVDPTSNEALPAPYAEAGDVAAMAWARGHTTPSARFVVLGDAAEWFPLFAHRTMLLSPWGAEWEGAEQFQFQKAAYDEASACGDAACIDRRLAIADVHPDYVVVPKGRFTVRRDRHVQSPGMRGSLVASSRYTVVFENEDAIVVRVDEGDAY